MYGGPGKLGRGGGAGRGAGGGNKRNVHSTFHPSPRNNRPSPAAAAVAPSGRLSMGGAVASQRNRIAPATTSGGAGSASSAATEESFSLVTGNPLNFAMMIRLTPDLVEEIMRAESEGSSARIKFDAIAGGNVNVGGKDFTFRWSREPGDLCDIYEERQSGEGGNGLLVESGSAWRKLNVNRVLDESTTNHVKMRSKEAESKSKSRKAIVLDPGNPSMKNNVKQMAAAESTSSWRNAGAPFKKRKAELPPGPTKSVQRSTLTPTPPSKGRPSPSHPFEQPVAPGSSAAGNFMKGHSDVEGNVSAQAMNRHLSSERGAADRMIPSAGRGKQGQKTLKGAQPPDLRSMLVSLLGESSSKGMSLKALEKAIGDAIPNSARQIEPILKKIAICQAPDSYFLKPGTEMESFKKLPASSLGQSSPEDNRHSSPAHDEQPPAPETTFPAISEANGVEHAEAVHNYEENNLVVRAEVSHHSTDRFGEKKVCDNSEGPVGSSSDSDSDSDSESDSSDSGTDSGTHSRSRSKSARGSGSGSSSDSGSEASTKSKEAFDEDVDIMTSDDDKQVKHKLGASEVGVSFKSPPLWPTSDGEHVRALSDEKQDGHNSDAVDIEIDSPEDQPVREVNVHTDSVCKQGDQKAALETMPPSLYYHHEDQEKHEYAARLHRELGNVSKNQSKYGLPDGSEKSSRGKYKSASVEKQGDKKLRSGNSQQLLDPGSRMTPLQGSQQMLPDRPFEDVTRVPSNQMGNRSRGDISSSFGSLKIVDQTTSGKSILDSQQSAQRSIDPSSRVKTSVPVEKLENDDDNVGHSAKHPVKLSKEDLVEKNKTPVDHHYRRHQGSSKDLGLIQNSPKDENSNFRDRSAVKGRPSLQRELSGLEMGEIGESLPEEAPGGGKQLSRRRSFKQSENWKPDSSKAKPASKMNTESRLSSPPNANIPVVSSVAEGIPKRGFPEYSAGDNSKPHPRRHQSRVDNVDNGTQLNRLVESSGRPRHADARSLDNTPELNGNFPSKGITTISQEHEPKRVAATSKKDKRRQKSKGIPDLNDKQKDNSLTGSSDGHQKRIESSSDENSCPYSKYEKDEPELKEPIKDWTQYTAYVDEFDEKYGAYISLNNILEGYRQEFLQYERDLEAAKGNVQRCNDIERQIKKSYRQCGEKVKRLKNIFGVLHVELEHLKRMIHAFGTPYLEGRQD